MAYGFESGKNMVPVQEQHVTRRKYLSNLDWSATPNADGYYYQTVSIDGVTADNTVFVSSDTATMKQYSEAGAFAFSQGDGTLTFYCTSKPNLFLGVNVVILGV